MAAIFCVKTLPKQNIDPVITETLRIQNSEVWGQVMFLHVEWKGGRGLCMMSFPVWLPVPMFLLEDPCPWSHVPPGWGGLCPWYHVPSRWSLSRGSHCGQRPPWTETLPLRQPSGRYTSYLNAYFFQNWLSKSSTCWCNGKGWNWQVVIACICTGTNIFRYLALYFSCIPLPSNYRLIWCPNKGMRWLVLCIVWRCLWTK